MVDEGFEQFRRQVTRRFGGRAGRGDRYPETLRLEAVSIARQAIAQGESTGWIARRLGIRPATLSRWLASSPETQEGLRPVELIEPTRERVDSARTTGRLVLFTAGGHRIEGLAVDEMAYLLEALG